MKKLLSIAIGGMVLFSSSSLTFAASHVSQMATTKGGQHVAECAQKMDKGVSECAQLTECQKEM
ncbi:hypothetical protein [Tepidibacter aestuarii]|uniref:hypothetical protein n=1 Tax=Tepidibacter aestuarii TaxID=2925782 RepID=UPI0020BD522A|nr:hypothetical protein [Tepidibacter aestuarii]CAH2215059.1 conserved exported protein of unknown function [Tepidibacter aestuarii]